MTDGVLVVDKPRGPTSHDVVARVRRALGTRAVGHAGTLDPMATGVLVIAVGEATKLVQWLTADDKEYEATIALGRETDTLDAEGTVVSEAPVPELDRAHVEAVLASFVGRTRQRVPAVSAVRIDGERMYARARRGEVVDAPERDVDVRAIELCALAPTEISLRVRCAKGFYVRALARDLAERLGTVGHLVALRRLHSGAFGLDAAVGAEFLEAAARGDQVARAELVARLVPLERACGAMRRVTLDRDATKATRHGKLLDARTLGVEAEPEGSPLALLDEAGALVAVATRGGDTVRVLRGFVPTAASS